MTRIPANPAFEIVFGWSTRVTAMYCVHWVVIGWSIGLVGHRTLDLPAVLVSMVVVAVATHLIVRGVARLPRLRGGEPTSAAPTEEPAPAPPLATTATT